MRSAVGSQRDKRETAPLVQIVAKQAVPGIWFRGTTDCTFLHLISRCTSRSFFCGNSSRASEKKAGSLVSTQPMSAQSIENDLCQCPGVAVPDIVRRARGLCQYRASHGALYRRSTRCMPLPDIA
eukprot:1595503-Rhodomonas_salina.5